MSLNSSSYVVGSIFTSIVDVVGAAKPDPSRSGVELTPPVHMKMTGLALKTSSCPGSTVTRQNSAAIRKRMVVIPTNHKMMLAHGVFISSRIGVFIETCHLGSRPLFQNVSEPNSARVSAAIG